MRIVISLVLLLTICDHATAQIRKFAFQQLTEEHGLSQNFVYGLTQDVKGFLWISTGAGLSRYDGYEIKQFSTHDSLSADFITSDYLTASGNLLFGHNNGGVTLYDGLQFKKLLPDTLGSKVVSITESVNKFFWIATQSKGLIFVDYDNGKILPVFPPELEGQIINAIFARGDILWVGTNEGLQLFRMKGYSLTRIDTGFLPPYVSVNAFLQHRSDPDLVWIGTGFSGVYLIKNDRTSTKFSVLRTFNPEALSGDVVQTIAQDADDDLWVGTRQNGMLYMNLTRNGASVFKTTHFRKRTGYPFVSVNKVIIDRQGQVWVSSMGNGIVKIFKEFFTYFPFAEPFGVSDVRSITETQSGYLVGTDAGLLKIVLDSQTDEYQVTSVDALGREPILSVFTDSRENTWIGTETKGVFIFSDKTSQMQRVRIDPVKEPVEARLFEEDIAGNMWISARANGVYELDSAKRVKRHLTTANRFIHNDVFAIKADSKGNIWFGTYGAGLAMLTKDQELLFLSKQGRLKARDINDIDEDDAGNIWIATEGDGFFKYASDTIVQIGSAENLVSPFIKGMQFDPTGRMWFSYRKGLGYFDLQSEKKHHFSKQDGLLATEAYSSSIIVDSRANKWFCNDFGVTLFEHDTIANERKPLETYITGLRIFFKQYQQESENRGTAVSEAAVLSLNHDQNHVTFDFVAVKLNRTGEIYYRHFLEGYDSEWTPPEKATFVTYTNLDPGKYNLKVQATDDLGAWVDPVTNYSFVISPPYWKRTWFYFLQIFSVVALFTVTYFIGKKGTATKRYVVRLMLFSSFFITLEYVENFIDPLVSDFFGGAPVFRFFLNFLLALLVMPVETIISRWLMERQLAAEAQTQQVNIEEEILMQEDKVTSPRE